MGGARSAFRRSTMGFGGAGVSDTFDRLRYGATARVHQCDVVGQSEGIVLLQDLQCLSQNLLPSIRRSPFP